MPKDLLNFIVEKKHHIYRKKHPQLENLANILETT